MRWLGLGLLLVGAHAFAAAPVRPKCDADHAGRFWPEEANENPKFAAALMPYGYPEVCTLRAGKYEWRSFTVPVKQLPNAGKQRKPSPAKSEKSSATSER